MNTQTIISEFKNGTYDELLMDIYVDKEIIPYQKKRYVDAVASYEKYFGQDDVSIYSAPGRSEIGGNHTDHQCGEVLAAAINRDVIAIVKPLVESEIKVISEGYDMLMISLDDLAMEKAEQETTIALIKGVLAGVKERGYTIGGFQAYVTSDVLIGAGLSSSAAYETVMGTILSGLYNDMNIPATEIAMIGQYAENVYFGKPCGLMDQMACSVGNLVHIDFAEPKNPAIESVKLELTEYSLCIVDTKGSHADLTADYAAIPKEMRKVASYFGKDVLREVSKEVFLEELVNIRNVAGDRAVLRALHFFEENERVKKEVEALKSNQIDAFFELIQKSGDSSYKYLQNVYSNQDVQTQNVSIALALSDMYLQKQGVSRIHGGGFAGTIQAFVKNEIVSEYQRQMELVFGSGACSVLKIRKYGGMQVL